MTQETTYNGWKNYETWCVNLWLTNEPYTEETLREIAQGPHQTYTNADRLKRYVTEELLPDIGGMAGDLLMAAVSEVDWYEIVENHEHDDEAVTV